MSRLAMVLLCCSTWCFACSRPPQVQPPPAASEVAAEQPIPVEGSSTAAPGASDATAVQPGHPDQIIVLASDTTFGPCPPGLPQPCEMAVLEGDPRGTGVFATRFRMGAGLEMPPHHHPRSERVTIISGKVGVGFGDQADRSKGRLFGPGDFYINAAHAKHYVWVEEDAVLQINGVGPWQAIMHGSEAPPAPPAPDVAEPAMPAGTQQVVLTAGEDRFQPCPPQMPAGCEMTVMEGELGGSTLFSARFRAPAGFQMPPHHHPQAERVTVISGQVGVGFGESADRSAGRLFGPGDFYVNPPNVNHFVWIEQDAVLQINGVGPWKAVAAGGPAH